jgi:hypothetical protein
VGIKGGGTNERGEGGDATGGATEVSSGAGGGAAIGGAAARNMAGTMDLPVSAGVAPVLIVLPRWANFFAAAPTGDATGDDCALSVSDSAFVMEIGGGRVGDDGAPFGLDSGDSSDCDTMIDADGSCTDFLSWTLANAGTTGSGADAAFPSPDVLAVEVAASDFRNAIFANAGGAAAGAESPATSTPASLNAAGFTDMDTDRFFSLTAVGSKSKRGAPDSVRMARCKNAKEVRFRARMNRATSIGSYRLWGLGSGLGIL